MNSFGTDKGTTIRYPSTANLMIYSSDSEGGATDTSADIQITRAQAIQNGFFTRITSSEIVMNWFIPNIYNLNDISGLPFSVDVSGVGNISAKVPNDFYNAAQLIDTVVAQLNTLGAGTWSVVQNGPLGKIAISSTSFWRPSSSGLSDIWDYLGMGTYGALTPRKQAWVVGIPRIRSFAYLDFVSEQITYNQDLKDFSTALVPKDVLARWWFERTDDQTPIDKYGYPILYGYAPFKERRLFTSPKQIKWDPIQPLGNIRIQVYYGLEGVQTETYPEPLDDLIKLLFPQTSPPSASYISGTRQGCFSYGLTFQLSEN